MLKRAYDIGVKLALEEALGVPVDPAEVSNLVAAISSIQEPEEIDRTDAMNRSDGDVSTGVSWQSKIDLSKPVGY
jgi:hypothetical protein